MPPKVPTSAKKLPLRVLLGVCAALAVDLAIPARHASEALPIAVSPDSLARRAGTASASFANDRVAQHFTPRIRFRESNEGISKTPR